MSNKYSTQDEAPHPSTTQLFSLPLGMPNTLIGHSTDQTLGQILKPTQD